MWIPDVYHGAPTSITLILGSAPKLAAFAVVMRLLVDGLLPLAVDWQQMLAFMAIASLLIGNLVGVVQTNLKRMLAYSTISHMGFLLLGLMSGVVNGEVDTGTAQTCLQRCHVLRGDLCADRLARLRHHLAAGA